MLVWHLHVISYVGVRWYHVSLIMSFENLLLLMFYTLDFVHHILNRKPYLWPIWIYLLNRFLICTLIVIFGFIIRIILVLVIFITIRWWIIVTHVLFPLFWIDFLNLKYLFKLLILLHFKEFFKVYLILILLSLPNNTDYFLFHRNYFFKF
jgi:hypothetical protein